MDLSRRDLLKSAGAAGAAAVATLPTASAVGATNKPGKGPRYGMVIDLRRCFGCHACAVSCKAEQAVPLGNHKSWVNVTESGKYPNASRTFVPVLCNHCDKPPCVEICPVDSTKQRADGIVTADDKTCIGCLACTKVCPYGVRYMADVGAKKKKAHKCDLCVHRVDQGLLPACVNTCNARARIFGDLNDPASAIRKVLAANKGKVKTLRPDKGTESKVFYIGLADGDFYPPKGPRLLLQYKPYQEEEEE